MTARTIGILVILSVSAPARGQSAGEWLLPNLALRLSVEVSNKGDREVRALATIPVLEARRAAPDFPGTFAIAVMLNPAGSATLGSVIASQSDDLDGDGAPDQFEFPVVLAAGERRRVDIYYSTTIEDSIAWPKRVHAKHGYGYNREVAALESELIGYRTYGGFFLDVMAREEGNPGLNNDVAGYIPIRRDLGTGRDVFHIGDSLGLGGIFLRRNGKLYQPPMNVPTYAHKPSPGMVPHYRVISRGPLRAMIETVLEDWNLDGDLVNVTAQYSIDAGEPFVRCRFHVDPLRIAPGHEYEIGAGIRDLPAESQFSANGRLTVVGKQNERDGAIGLALYYDANRFLTTPPLRTSESMNQAVVFADRLTGGRAVSGSYAVAAAWTGSGIKDPGHYLSALSATVQAQIEMKPLQFSRTPRPDRVEAEAQ